MKLKLSINPDAEEYLEASVHKNGAFVKKLEELVDEYNGEGKLTAYTEDDITMLSPSDIECVTVEDNKTFAVTVNREKFRLKQRLYELEQSLPSDFIRINKSSVANKTHIERFTAAFSGAVNVVFKSGHTDYVSRRCFAEIKRGMKTK